MRGIFVNAEGIDGVGKSSVLEWMKEKLEGHHRKEVIVARDPGATRIGEAIRNVLLNPDHMEMEQKTEFLLHIASRAQLVEEVINPALESGAIVLADRWILSTLVYDGIVGGIGCERVLEMAAYFLGGLKPDLTLLFKLDPNEAFERVKKTGTLDRIERRGVPYLEKLNAAYELAAPMVGAEEVDASQPMEVVAQECLNRVMSVSARSSRKMEQVVKSLEMGKRFKSQW